MLITLQGARNNKRYTQKELGEKLGKSEFTIANWESGKTAPNINDFKKLCQILEVPIDQLILPNNQVKVD